MQITAKCVLLPEMLFILGKEIISVKMQFFYVMQIKENIKILP